MTKGALDVLGRPLANGRVARNITVNTVAPGTTEIDMIGWLRHSPEAAAGVAASSVLGRVVQSEDVAAAVAFLASDDARWVTGHVDASGGLFPGPGVFRPSWSVRNGRCRGSATSPAPPW